MKSLKVVQTMSRVLEIITRVGMILMFVGAGIGLVGGGVLLIVGNVELPPELVRMLVSEIPPNHFALAMLMLAYAAICLGGALIFTAATRYFKHEQQDGTPFTERGARELMFLGIKTLAYQLGAVIIAAILCAYGQVSRPFTNETEAGIGVALILISFVFRYGAELELEKKARTNGGQND